ncbi:ATP-dependent RNA helicase ddx42 [Mortierella alpina]|nr:ATP-dependent RNA helicase ddx42 [Mortierella alpina]
MSLGKRSININLGGASGTGSGLNARPNPLGRPAKSALGFNDDDDEDDDNDPSGPPKRKLIKLDHTQDNDVADSSKLKYHDDDAFSRLGSSKASGAELPPLRKHAAGGGDDDDDDDGFSRLQPKKEPSKNSSTDQADQEGDDDYDPLDAFMAEIDTQVQQEAEKPSEEKVRRDDIEDEDYVESYMKHMKKKGIAIGQGGPIRDRDENADSDEEVYATARAIDNAADQYDADEVSYDPQANVKKEITPLPRVDHSRQDYMDIEKCFYQEHEDIAKLPEDQVRQIRADLDMRVTGADVAKPCISFAHFGFEEALMETIRRAGYSEPSGIQRQAIPVALSGRDIIGIAATGSGKTAAFLLPMIVHIMDQPELEKGDGPIGVILAPTRELADQIYNEAKRFAKAYGLRVAVVYGGASKQDQFKTLRSGVEIVVAAPGRLIDMVKIKATNFKRTSFLVLDEADRVFDFGFEPQVRSICDNIRPDRQTLLFSATFQKRVERLAREVMTDPVRISIGNVGQINSDVTQVIHVLKDEALKWSWLMERLHEFEACECLHGDMQQQERDKAVHDFKVKVFPTLIATDVAARGLDIKSIRTVVNYDVARDIDSHVHRVGRTGRAGEKGTAYTLILEKEDRFAGELVRNLEESSQPVPPEVMKIAMQNPRFRKSRQFLAGHRGRGGGRGGGRGRGERGRGGRGGNSGAGRGVGSSDRFRPPHESYENRFSSSANALPLGQGSSGDHSRGSGSGYRVSGFQRASRPETGAEDLSTPTNAPHAPPSGGLSAMTRPPAETTAHPPRPPPGAMTHSSSYVRPPPPFPGHGYPPRPNMAHPLPPHGASFRPPPPPGMFYGDHQRPPQHGSHPPQHGSHPPPPHHHYRPPFPPHPQHGHPGGPRPGAYPPRPPSHDNSSHQNDANRRRRWDQ